MNDSLIDVMIKNRNLIPTLVNILNDDPYDTSKILSPLILLKIFTIKNPELVFDKLNDENIINIIFNVLVINMNNMPILSATLTIISNLIQVNPLILNLERFEIINTAVEYMGFPIFD
jgi:hypothetical protein